MKRRSSRSILKKKSRKPTRVSSRRRKRRSSRKRIQSGGWITKSPFVQGKSYKVNGAGIDDEIWIYKISTSKFNHNFINKAGKVVNVYRHGNRWRIGKAGTPISIVRNTPSALGRRMIRI